MTADDLIAQLELKAHPEGGWYRETFRDDASTAIYFLLRAGERSHWHRVRNAAEGWFFHLGAALELSVSRDGRSVESLTLGPARPQLVVPRGAWQAARTTGDFSLVSCTVAPPFAFEQFELAPPGWKPGNLALRALVAMKITTWNVNGLRAREGQLTEWVLREKPDVLCLQEIKASLVQVPEAICDLDGYHCYWHGGAGGYSGVALHVSKALAPKRPVFSHPAFDHEQRIVMAALGDLDVASIYVPNGGKDLGAKMRFLQAMAAWVEQSHARGRKLVLCGDLNVALEPRDVHAKLRNGAQIGQTPEERALIRRMIDAGLHDLLREQNAADDELFTWWAPWRQHKERNIGWRLDYVLASAAIAGKVKSCRVERMFGTSDHGPVTAVFEGALFDAAGIIEGPLQERPKKTEDEPRDRRPQLDLFGR